VAVSALNVCNLQADSTNQAPLAVENQTKENGQSHDKAV
jgi:hypothetical protein